jgi:hypothetical protein
MRSVYNQNSKTFLNESKYLPSSFEMLETGAFVYFFRSHKNQRTHNVKVPSYHDSNNFTEYF